MIMLRTTCCLLLMVFASGVVRCGEEAKPFEEFPKENEASIERSRRWLLRAQNRDGSWGLDAGEAGDITCTSLAGMALLASGAVEREGPDGESIRALRGAAEFVVKAARKAREDISPGQTTLIQSKLGRRVHNFFAVVFLTQLYGMRPADLDADTAAELPGMIANLTEIIARTQEPDGSWHKETFGSLKATCMAWLALRAASSTGVPIRHAAVDKTVRFIKAQYNAGAKIFDNGGQMSGYQALYATASCVRVLVGMGEGDEPRTKEAIDAFHQKCSRGDWAQMYLTVEGEDYLSAMMMTHSLVDQNPEQWQRWFKFIGPALLRRQNGDGSWATTACIRGRVFPTACALLTLLTPNRYLPIQQ